MGKWKWQIIFIQQFFQPINSPVHNHLFNMLLTSSQPHALWNCWMNLKSEIWTKSLVLSHQILKNTHFVHIALSHCHAGTGKDLHQSFCTKLLASYWLVFLQSWVLNFMNYHFSKWKQESHPKQHTCPHTLEHVDKLLFQNWNWTYLSWSIK